MGSGSIPGPAQQVKDLALLQLRLSGSDLIPWPKSSICHGAAKKKKERGKKENGRGSNERVEVNLHNEEGREKSHKTAVQESFRSF